MAETEVSLCWVADRGGSRKVWKGWGLGLGGGGRREALYTLVTFNAISVEGECR